MNRTPALAALLLASCTPASPPDLHVADAWARATVAGQTSTAAYLTIANRGGSADRLVAVAGPAPADVSLHETSYEGGVARMRALTNGLELPAGETIALRPAGPHIMIEKLPAPLEPGSSLRLTLRFATSGERAIEVPVRAATAHGSH